MGRFVAPMLISRVFVRSGAQGGSAPLHPPKTIDKQKTRPQRWNRTQSPIRSAQFIRLFRRLAVQEDRATTQAPESKNPDEASGKKTT